MISLNYNLLNTKNEFFDYIKDLFAYFPFGIFGCGIPCSGNTWSVYLFLINLKTQTHYLKVHY